MENKTARASNVKAISLLILPIVLLLASIGGFVLNTLPSVLLAHFLLSIFFTQCFILLHECGHLHFFKGQQLNRILGHVFGLLSGIPFYTWMHMHNLHHKWTGWRDLDPTTEKTIKPSSLVMVRIIVNVAWFLFIPIFYLGYMFSNYWNLFKIKRFLKPAMYKTAIVQVLVYFMVYAIVVYFFNAQLLKFILPGFLLSLIWKELIILTQHSHIEIPLANGNEVKPISYQEQIAFTRSFSAMPLISKYLLFNFNLHEAHHVQPGLPCYYLEDIELNNAPKSYFHWFKNAKRLSGNDFIFNTSKHSGRKF